MKGKFHPAYKHGFGEKNREYDPEKQAAWIQGVLRLSNSKCFLTGQSHDLECHHLIGWAHEPSRYMIENGVALAVHVHRSFHNAYGRGGNTPEQFERFCAEHYQITTFPWREGNHKPSFSLEEEEARRVELSCVKEKAFKALVVERQHEILEGEYIKNDSLFKIRCSIHGESFVSRSFASRNLEALLLRDKGGALQKGKVRVELLCFCEAVKIDCSCEQVTPLCTTRSRPCPDTRKILKKYKNL